MSDLHSHTELDLLDKGQQASRRVLAVTSLMMACGDDDSLEPADLRVVAQLLHEETRIMRDCLRHFSQGMPEKSPPHPQ